MKGFNSKYLIFGALALIIISIPITLYFISRQQNVQSNAEAASILTFEPTTKTDVKVGEEFSLDVKVDPGGKNVVSIVRLQLHYDPSKVEITDIQPTNPPFSVTIDGFQAASGTATISFGIGADVTQAIQTPTVVAKVLLKALATTEQPTQVSFDTSSGTEKATQVLSLASADNPGENVLSTTSPASITIIAGNATTSPTPSVTPTTTTAPTATPTPTTAPNQSPVCSSLVASATSGTAPLAVTFTVSGSDTDGTISKVSFNFGEGQSQDVTSEGGIGTNAVSVQASHTYNNPGTFTAQATLTDNKGATNSSATCAVSISATSGSTTGSGGTNGSTGQTTPIPTVPPTGSTATTIGVIGGVILTIIGGILFFAL